MPQRNESRHAMPHVSPPPSYEPPRVELVLTPEDLKRENMLGLIVDPAAPST